MDRYLVGTYFLQDKKCGCIRIIKNAKVELWRMGTLQAVTRTDDCGNYQFSIFENGLYELHSCYQEIETCLKILIDDNCGTVVIKHLVSDDTIRKV